MSLDDQYCTINAEIVAEYLERRSMPKFAKFVLYLSDNSRATYWESQEWKARFEFPTKSMPRTAASTGFTCSAWCPKRSGADARNL